MAPFVCTPCMTTTSSSDFNPSLQLHPCHHFARHSLCLAGRLAGPALLAVYITTAFVSPKSSTSCDGACPLSQAWCPRHLYHPCESPKSTFSCDGACPLSQAWCFGTCTMAHHQRAHLPVTELVRCPKHGAVGTCTMANHQRAHLPVTELVRCHKHGASGTCTIQAVTKEQNFM